MKYYNSLSLIGKILHYVNVRADFEIFVRDKNSYSDLKRAKNCLSELDEKISKLESQLSDEEREKCRIIRYYPHTLNKTIKTQICAEN